jgi:hypothetical protein
MAFLRQPRQFGLTSTAAALATDGREAIIGAHPELVEVRSPAMIVFKSFFPQ